MVEAPASPIRRRANSPSSPTRAGSRESDLESLEEDDDHPPEKCVHLVKRAFGTLVIPESNVGRMAYELVLLIMLLYVGTVFPYRLAFMEYKLRESNDDPCPSATEDPIGWQVWEIMVDWFFYIDLVLNFFLTYRKGSREIKDPCKIAKNYLCTYFIVNLIACLPEPAFLPLMEYIGVDPGGCGTGTNSNDAARFIRLQRATRLVRLARLLRMSRVAQNTMEQLSDQMQEALKKAVFLNMLIGLAWIVHILACGWYLCAALHVDHSETWVARRNTRLGRDSLLTEPSTVQWVHSMYFVLTVFTTVGFGDMSAVTSGEILYVILVMLVGAVVHSIIIGNVINLISEKSEDEMWRARQKNLLSSFGRQTLMQRSSINKLTDYIDQMEHAGTQDYDRQEMRNMITGVSLPRRLVGELPAQLFRGLLMESKFVTTCATACHEGAIPPRFTLLLATMLHVQYFKAHDIIFQLHDSASNIFIVQSGTFAAIGEPGPMGGSDATVFQSPTVMKPTTSGRLSPHAENQPDSPRLRPSAHVFETPLTSKTPSGPLTPKTPSGFQPTHPSLGHLKSAPSDLWREISSHHSKKTTSDVSNVLDTSGQSQHNYSSVLSTDCISTLNQQGSAWIPHVSDLEQWLEIDLGRSRFVSGVKVAGHPSADAWVTEFRVLTSTTRGFNQDVSHYIQEPDAFRGCFDGHTEVEVSFVPRMAQFIRIVPTGWHNRIGLRAGVMLSQNSLFPYMLRGRKNYIGEEVLIWSTRTYTLRCEADGEVLLLHKRDLWAHGVGARLYQDFPQFQSVLLSAAERRHKQRLDMLDRLTRGCSYRHLAANLIQRFWRGMAGSGTRRDSCHIFGLAAGDLSYRKETADLTRQQENVPSSSADPKIAGVVTSVNELRHDVTSLNRKLDGMTARQGALAGQLEAVAVQLQQLVASKR